ncbi:hypothetical protein ANCDUO_26918 [Ancylostoma duodenale]|uniref:Uncharacterized protein n=1 Tax=Ancylostoma duodenale TaxID=51022 RepID=A0A0C2F3H7_9BILA|nr:hypothetical protein ANCDUO_26918 [Ancylostoma duodenale]
MGSPPSPLWDFCGFVNGSSFRTKYFMDESTMTLTPCGEFAVVVTQSIPLLFFSVSNLMLISWQITVKGPIPNVRKLRPALLSRRLSITAGPAPEVSQALRRLREDGDGYVQLHGCADESAGFLSRIFFCWTNVLIRKGGKLQLHSIDDVFLLPPSLEVARIEHEMVENSPTFYSDGQHYSLSSALLSTYGLAFFSLGVLRLASDAFTFAGPILLHVLVEVLENPAPNSLGFLYAGLMVLCSFLAALFSTNFTFYMQKISLK